MKQRPRSPQKRKHPKTHLRLPDLDYSKTAVLNSLSSVDGQRGYGHAIDEFVDWYCSEPRLALNRTVVLRYRSYLEARLLAPGTINLRLGAVRRLAYEAADCGLLSADLAARNSPGKGREKSWSPPRQLAERPAEPGTLAGSQPYRPERQTGSRASCAVACLWSAPARSSRTQARTPGTTGGTLGHRQSEGQGWTRSHSSCARMGHGRASRLVECIGDRPRKDLSSSHEDGKDAG